MAIGLSGKRPVTSQSGFTLIGNTAPDFNLILFDGNEFTLSDYYGSPIVLNFWASWCQPCRVEAPTLGKVYKEFQDQSVEFIGVDVWDNIGDAEIFLQQEGHNYPNGFDAEGVIAIDYGVRGIPEKYFIDRHGVLVKKLSGPLTEATLRRSLNELLSRLNRNHPALFYEYTSISSCHSLGRILGPNCFGRQEG